MGKITGIGYVHSTVNGSSGCDGCELWGAEARSCYAAAVHENRLAQSKSTSALYAKSFSEVREIPGRFARAASWGPPRPGENAEKPWLDGRPRHIFVGDMGDFLSAAVSDAFLQRELLGAITSKLGQRHVWLLLTKRPSRLARLSAEWGGLPDNVIAMTTVTSQQTADARIPHLLQVQCKTRGLSLEPLLGSVQLDRCAPHFVDGDTSNPAYIDAFSGTCYHPLTCSRPLPGVGPAGIQWVIVGGESGATARPLDPEWARSLRAQCIAAGAAFFFKQWGGRNKAAAGRMLDGQIYSGMPDVTVA